LLPGFDDGGRAKRRAVAERCEFRHPGRIASLLPPAPAGKVGMTGAEEDLPAVGGKLTFEIARAAVDQAEGVTADAEPVIEVDRDDRDAVAVLHEPPRQGG